MKVKMKYWSYVEHLFLQIYIINLEEKQFKVIVDSIITAVVTGQGSSVGLQPHNVHVF